MASGMTSNKRFAVRLSLVTTSTLALIMGAQSLATLDTVNAAAAATEHSAGATVTNTAASTTETVIANAAPQITILRHAAPSITIQAHDSTASTTATKSSTAAAPATMQPPVPVVVSSSSQSFSIPMTRSSR
ncbi:MAG: hypothetical protein JNL34_06235 [Anaerolineae bacterium]|nr:hypothetical protein [Anaerolineae bacterium]